MYHLITIGTKNNKTRPQEFQPVLLLNNWISPNSKNTDVYFVQNKLQVDTKLNILNFIPPFQRIPPPPPLLLEFHLMTKKLD